MKLAVFFIMTRFNNKYRIKSIRLPGWNYALPGVYFITICTNPKIRWFGNIRNGTMKLNNVGNYILNEWIYTSKIRKNVLLDAFIVMPDHIHGIISIIDHNMSSTQMYVNVETHSNASLQRGSILYKNKFGPQKNNLSSIIRGFKSKTTKHIRLNFDSEFGWQSRFYEHIIKNKSELIAARKYIQNNPKNW
jgi:putative transposase